MVQDGAVHGCPEILYAERLACIIEEELHRDDDDDDDDDNDNDQNAVSGDDRR